MSKNVAFTIVAQNYVGYALTLADSMKNSNPDVDFRIYFADGIGPELLKVLEKKGVKYHNALELNPDLFLKMAFYYEVTEYCTSIKPFIMKSLLSEEFNTVTYIDPDIYVYNDLSEPVFSYLSTHSIFLTPHICYPIEDEFKPNEEIHLVSGTYNLGFISIANNDETVRFIQWWSERCENNCFNEQTIGLFVDQKWINLVPGLFEGVYISRDLGLNVAYWNMHERLYDQETNKINNKFDLTFFHFSGINVNSVDVISKHQNRYTLSQRSDLKPLFDHYSNAVIENISSVGKLPSYRFIRYNNGKSISILARRAYFVVRNNFASPFESVATEKQFFEHLSKLRINEKITSNEMNDKEKISTSLSRLATLMKWVQVILGPYRYASLLRAFKYLSSLKSCDFLYK